MAGHGGKRQNAGRKNTRVPDEVVVDKGFATRVLKRIGEVGKFAAVKLEDVKSDEDYQLMLLGSGDMQTRSYNFNKLLDRKYGKPAQSVIKADTRENARDLDFGDLPMPATSAKSGEAGKPN